MSLYLSLDAGRALRVRGCDARVAAHRARANPARRASKSSSSAGLRRDHQFNEWTTVTQLALRFAGFMLDIAQLSRFSVLARRYVVRRWNSAEEIIEEVDQRRLAAKIQLQRFFFATGSEQGRRHLAKDVDIRAAKTVDRLLAIADDEEVRRTAAFCKRSRSSSWRCNPFVS